MGIFRCRVQSKIEVSSPAGKTSGATVVQARVRPLRRERRSIQLVIRSVAVSILRDT